MMMEQSNEDLGILLAMTYVAWADGTLTEVERELIKQEVADQGLDEEEEAILLDAILSVPAPEAILVYLPEMEARMAGLVAAYVIAIIDGVPERMGIEACETLAHKFGIPDSERVKVSRFAERQVKLSRSNDWRKAMYLEEWGQDM